VNDTDLPRLFVTSEEVDVVPPQRYKLAGAQPMAVKKASPRIAVIAVRRGHVPRDRARTMRAITPFFVIILVMLLISLPFVIKWFFTGSTYGVYY
jgi:hypothetical protein